VLDLFCVKPNDRSARGHLPIRHDAERERGQMHNSRNGKIGNHTAVFGSGVAEEGYNLRDLRLIGSGSGTGIVLNSAMVIIDNIELGNHPVSFSIGMTAGSNAFLDEVMNSRLWFNTQNFYFPGAQTPNNSGENIVFDHDIFSNGGNFANCVQIGDFGYDGPQLHFIRHHSTVANGPTMTLR